MAERDSIDPVHQRNTEEGGVNRRGMFARAAALAGAGLAWMMGSETVEATHGGGIDPAALHVNELNLATARTFMVRDAAGDALLNAFNGTGTFSYGAGDGIQSYSNKGNGGAGIRSVSSAATRGMGVLGSGTAGGTGVAGTSGFGGFLNNPPAGVGVYGQANADYGIAVRGQILTTSAPPNSVAVYGENLSSNAAPTTAFGCYGFSAKGHGLVGATGVAGGSAVVGSTNGVAGAYAGIFYGPLVITGDFAVVGSKSAAVPYPDGSHRLLYCVESPESWFEDFGKGQLTDGGADVTLDSAFAAVADMADYHVFVTAYDQFDDLMVSNRTESGFRVSARDCASNGSFSWRVVAKRKDVTGARFAKVSIPPPPVLQTPRIDETVGEQKTKPAPPPRAPHSHSR